VFFCVLLWPGLVLARVIQGGYTRGSV
jgi:hypothetical protein